MINVVIKNWLKIMCCRNKEQTTSYRLKNFCFN